MFISILQRTPGEAALKLPMGSQNSGAHQDGGWHATGHEMFHPFYADLLTVQSHLRHDSAGQRRHPES